MAKILIVDDEPDNITLLAYELEDDGHEVYSLENGQKCIEQAIDIEPDIILLDLYMPALDGMETLKRLKSKRITAAIPVIMITADDKSQKIVEAMDLGAQDYITKPLSYPILSARMRSALRLKESQRQLYLANQNLAKMAYKDPLTNVYNRRYFSARAIAEFNKSRRYKRPLAIIMLDIDNFKKINDQFGHAMGDAALIELTQTCGTLIRAEDFIGRMGGEEFCICCPETDIDGATHLAERMRIAILQNPTTHEKDSCLFTVSFGVTKLLETDTNFEQAYERADNLLYQAKDQGRNRVVAAQNASARPHLN